MRQENNRTEGTLRLTEKKYFLKTNQPTKSKQNKTKTKNKPPNFKKEESAQLLIECLRKKIRTDVT